MKPIRAERRWWILAGLYILAIYGAAYFAQFLFEQLRERGWLELTIGLAFASVALVLVVSVWRLDPQPREWLVVPVALVIYGSLWWALEVIQERVHLIQYGLLAALLLAALEARRRRLGSGRPYLGSFLLTAVAGWGDELVQAVLPNRVYDLRDVALNALSGGVLLALVALHRRLRMRPIATDARQPSDLP